MTEDPHMEMLYRFERWANMVDNQLDPAWLEANEVFLESGRAGEWYSKLYEKGHDPYKASQILARACNLYGFTERDQVNSLVYEVMLDAIVRLNQAGMGGTFKFKRGRYKYTLEVRVKRKKGGL